MTQQHSERCGPPLSRQVNRLCLTSVANDNEYLGGARTEEAPGKYNFCGGQRFHASMQHDRK